MRTALPDPTDRLDFRWWGPADAALATALWGDPAVTRLIDRRPRLPPHEIALRLAREIANGQALGFQYWPLFVRETAAFAGCCGLRPRDAAALEFGFHLVPSAWGQGLATEAGESVVRFAFASVGAAALSAGHHPENLASGRVLEKLGFRVVGAEVFEPTGAIHPALWLTRDAWVGV